MRAVVTPGRTMEVCVAQDWGSLEGAKLDATVKFQPGCSSLESAALRGTRSVDHDPARGAGLGARPRRRLAQAQA